MELPQICRKPIKLTPPLAHVCIRRTPGGVHGRRVLPTMGLLSSDLETSKSFGERDFPSQSGCECYVQRCGRTAYVHAYFVHQPRNLIVHAGGEHGGGKWMEM